MPASVVPLFELALSQVDGRGLASIAAFKLEAHLLTFKQISYNGACDRRDVNEYILRAVVRLNEAVTLLRIEPCYGSAGHCRPFQKRECRRSDKSDGSNFSTEREQVRRSIALGRASRTTRQSTEYR